MQTYSHFLLTAVLRDQLIKRDIAQPGRAFLVGSVLPDVPLLLLTIGYAASQRGGISGEFFGASYDQLYFHNPWWIAGHNLFHALPLILLYGLIGYWGRQKGKRWGPVLFWLAAGCGFHAIIDIFTHVTDGPVLFFPLNWSYRFRAPVSYWDPTYGGRIFAPLEHLLDLVLIAYLVVGWRQARKQKKLLINEPGADPRMMNGLLIHVSEEPGITQFAPRPAKDSPTP